MCVIKAFVLVTVLVFQNYSMAASKCEVVGKVAAAVYVYCPKEMLIDDIAKEAKLLSVDHFNHQMNQVHMWIFNSKKHTPKNSKAYDKMPDADLNKYLVAITGINKNTNHKSFKCWNKGNLKDCDKGNF